MEKLDEIINSFVESKKSVFDKKVPEKDIDEFCCVLSKDIKENIIKEVKEACINEITDTAQKKINIAEEEKAIKEAKVLLWNGFLMAFVVGILVNQITDIISFYKGGVEKIAPTIVICIILIFICVGIYIYTFMNKFIDIVRERKERKS